MKERYPNEPAVNSSEDANAFTICGIRGYNFAPYKFDQTKIRLSKDNDGLFKKLLAGRCDLIIGYHEVFQGFQKMGQMNLEGLDWIEIPDSTPLEFHVMVSKKWPGGERLRDSIDAGLSKLKADGSYQEIMQELGIYGSVGYRL